MIPLKLETYFFAEAFKSCDPLESWWFLKTQTDTAGVSSIAASGSFAPLMLDHRKFVLVCFCRRQFQYTPWNWRFCSEEWMLGRGWTFLLGVKFRPIFRGENGENADSFRKCTGILWCSVWYCSKLESLNASLLECQTRISYHAQSL